MQTSCDHLCRYFPVHRTVITKSGYRTGLIVIIPIQTVPCFSFQFSLPFVHDSTHFFHLRFSGCPFTIFAVCGSHMFKLKHHVQFASIQIRIFLCFFRCNTRRFTNSDQIKSGKYTFVHFLQIFMYMGTVTYIWRHITMQTIPDFPVRICRVFGNHTDNIHAESVYSLFTPPGHHAKYFVTYCRVLPVKIRLLFGETMQIVHAGCLIKLPCGTTKTCSPVCRLFAVFRIFPDIIIAVWIIFRFFTFQKPSVLIGAVIYYQIHHQFDTAFMHLCDHPVKIFHCSEISHDILIIRNIISIIIVR